MERVLWTDERLDDAFENLRGDIASLRVDWEKQRDYDVKRRDTEVQERKKDRWAFTTAIIATFGVLTPVILVIVTHT